MPYTNNNPTTLSQLSQTDRETFIRLRRKGGIWREIRRDENIIQLETAPGSQRSFLYDFDREALTALWRAGFVTCVPRQTRRGTVNEWRLL